MNLRTVNDPPDLSSCRAGVCGTCAAPVLTGRVDYAEAPVHEIEPGMALLWRVAPWNEDPSIPRTP